MQPNSPPQSPELPCDRWVVGTRKQSVRLSERGRALTEVSSTVPDPQLQQPGSIQGPLRARVVRPKWPDLSVRGESSTKENVKSGDVPNLLGKSVLRIVCFFRDSHNRRNSSGAGHEASRSTSHGFEPHCQRLSFQCFKTYYNVPTINLDVVMPD